MVVQVDRQSHSSDDMHRLPVKNTVHQRLTLGYACLVSCRVGMPTLSSRPGAREPSAVARSPTGSHEARMPARGERADWYEPMDDA